MPLVEEFSSLPIRDKGCDFSLPWFQREREREVRLAEANSNHFSHIMKVLFKVPAVSEGMVDSEKSKVFRSQNISEFICENELRTVRNKIGQSTRIQKKGHHGYSRKNKRDKVRESYASLLFSQVPHLLFLPCFYLFQNRFSTYSHFQKDNFLCFDRNSVILLS